MGRKKGAFLLLITEEEAQLISTLSRQTLYQTKELAEMTQQEIKYVPIRLRKLISRNFVERYSHNSWRLTLLGEKLQRFIDILTSEDHEDEV